MGGYDDTSIASFDFHHSMLTDDLRVQSFLRAIHATVRPGDVVVDIGTGTGLLSLFSAMAGARTVYAIEREPIITVAEEIVERNGYGDVVSFIEGSSLGVELPERADVLVTETIGSAGFDEGITRWVRDARERLLKPDARVIPHTLELVGSLVTVPRDYGQIDRWAQPLLTLDLAPLRRIAVNNVVWADLSPAHESSNRQSLAAVDLGDASPSMGSTVEFTASVDGPIHGLGVWFRSELAPGIEISNQPPNALPSWEQGLLPLDQPLIVGKGQTIDAELRVDDDGATWAWRVGDSPWMSTQRGSLALGASKRPRVSGAREAQSPEGLPVIETR